MYIFNHIVAQLKLPKYTFHCIKRCLRKRRRNPC